jgi:GNAT superfamily N-acetyltransferase
MQEITYGIEPNLSADEFIDCLVRSTLSERRPVDDIPRIAQMIQNADIMCTARNLDGQLIGVARSISDFSYCTYLSDLAVDVTYQRRGIGKELIRRSHAVAGEHTMLVLLAAPKAASYYPHIGMLSHPSAWYIPRSC